MDIFAIGAVGGSGTRVIAQSVKELSCNIGSDLNPANDNLWFTLLFKRQNILEASNNDIEILWKIFVKGMEGNSSFDQREIDLLRELSNDNRLQHSTAWLEKRVASLLQIEPFTNQKVWWGWKEPNTHVVIEKLYAINPTLKYIHVIRNGLDMAYSSNQNQTSFWGEQYTGVDYSSSPQYSLKYWCAVHKKMNLLSQKMRANFLYLNFDDYCLNPGKELKRLLGFLGVGNTMVNRDKIQDLVKKPTTIGRYKQFGIDTFDPKDIKFVSDMGFDISL